MRKSFFILSFLFLTMFFPFNSYSLIQTQANLNLEEILNKNIQACGEKKLIKIKTFSFEAGPYGPYAYYLTSDGKMKVVFGKQPIIREVTIVSQEGIKRNCFNEITNITGVEKAQLQCLAKLYSGIFTLIKFKDQLVFEGLKSFGPEKLYLLTTQIDDLKVNFYLDSQKFTITRISFEGYDEEQGKHEVNYDFGPFQEINGIKIPSSWFVSQVGTRGILYEISNVKLNPSFPKDFFTNLEVSVGNVKASPGFLEGNVIDFRAWGNNIVISTNWTEKSIEKAGFKTNEHLILLLDEIKLEIVFYKYVSEAVDANAYAPGAKFMTFNERMDNSYWIRFYNITPEETSQITKILKLLLPIQLKRKQT